MINPDKIEREAHAELLAAQTAQTKASTIQTYINAGFTAASAVIAVDSGDLGALKQ